MGYTIFGFFLMEGQGYACLLTRSVMAGRSSELNTKKLMLIPNGYARFKAHLYQLSHSLCDTLFIDRAAMVSLLLVSIGPSTLLYMFCM